MAQGADKLQASHDGHMRIGYDCAEGEAVSRSLGQAILAVDRQNGIEMEPPKHQFRQGANGGFVIDYEDLLTLALEFRRESRFVLDGAPARQRRQIYAE